MRTLFNGKPTDALLTRTTVIDLANGYFEGNVRNNAANFARARKEAEYSLNAPQRQESVSRKSW
jgi:hypothetical protein